MKKIKECFKNKSKVIFCLGLMSVALYFLTFPLSIIIGDNHGILVLLGGLTVFPLGILLLLVSVFLYIREGKKQNQEVLKTSNGLKNINNNLENKLPAQTFSIVIMVMIGFSVLAGFFDLINLLTAIIFSRASVSILSLRSVIMLVMSSGLFYGFLKRKKWTYYFTWLLFIFSIGVYMINFSESPENFIGIIVAGLILYYVHSFRNYFSY